MLSAETELHLCFRLTSPDCGVNDLAAWCFGFRNQIGQQVLEQVLDAIQARHLEQVINGDSEFVCKRCGVVHSGPGSILRRGTRSRQLRTSSGVIRFKLLQVTCSACRATWSPFTELLGLADRQRVSEELLRRLCDWVTNLSYEKTSRMGREWLGASISPRSLHREVQRRGETLEFTAGPKLGVLVADATRVPAGERERGEEACIAFQIIGRSKRKGRPLMQKRVVGLGVGWGSWEEALATRDEPELVVTDGEPGIHEVVANYFPNARHQQCEWHVPHTLRILLGRDGVPFREGCEIANQLRAVLKRGGKRARDRYAAFAERLNEFPTAYSMLTNATDYVLYPERSVVRTTSHAEREMREVNRRVDVGVRWSVKGVTNMLRLRLAQRHNSDDYQRVWTDIRPATFTLVPQP